ncbi:MAG: sugar ABC transporter ATP-binding protein [Candidatus Limiplasma sp.]|nr:sugar ABC transporter ATP-binding protein [Candidatus Limiplasma sp.]
MEPKTIVAMKQITMSFSGNQVLKAVDFGLRQGEVHSLMGANGAGKSTLIKILNGIYTPVSGSIEVEGVPARIRQPKDAEKYGLAFVHQELNVCPDMTVAENMYIGNWATSRRGVYDRKKTSRNAAALLQGMGVSLDPDAPVRYLRTAEKQIIEILKTLTRNARVIILDEPTSSLNEKEKDNFFEIIAKLKASGVSIIFISHFLEDVIRLSDRVTVLKDGVNNGVFERGAYTKEDLVTAMMGRNVEHGVYEPLDLPLDAPIALELRGLCGQKRFQNISMEIRAGDIVGVCGLLGAGKTEIARAVFGLDEIDSGKVVLFGEEISRPRPDLMIQKGVALLTEERKLEGFVPLLGIHENASLSILKSLRKGFTIDRGARDAFAQSYVKKMSIKCSSLHQPVTSLSGGNQQKVVLAKCLAGKPRLFLLDEPTRGVDVFAKSEIYKILRQAVETQGTTVIIFSSEMEELLANCSKIIILKKGQVAGVVDSTQVTKNDLLALIG